MLYNGLVRYVCPIKQTIHVINEYIQRISQVFTVSIAVLPCVETTTTPY